LVFSQQTNYQTNQRLGSYISSMKTNMTTITALILATLLWGLWGIADKYAVEQAHPFTVQWMYAIPYVLTIPLWFWLGKTIQPQTNLNPTAFMWAIIASCCSMLALLLLLFALQRKPASLAVAFTSAYPLVTLLIASLMGAERVTLPKVAGLLLILVGLVVLQWSES
jgi:drug/metabolite transporter (DMT)-like permease